MSYRKLAFVKERKGVRKKHFILSNSRQERDFSEYSKFSERSNDLDKSKVRKSILTSRRKKSDSDEYSHRSDDLGIVRYQKSNHAGHRRVKNRTK